MKESDFIVRLARLGRWGIGAGLVAASLAAAGCAGPSIFGSRGASSSSHDKAAARRNAVRSSFPTAAQAGIPSVASSDGE